MFYAVDFLIDFLFVWFTESRCGLDVVEVGWLVGWLVGDPRGTGEVKTPDRLIRAWPAVMVVVVVNTDDGDALPPDGHVVRPTAYSVDI